MGIKDDPKLTTKTIAKLAGVSIATVSRVLNHNTTVKEDTRRKILEIIEKFNVNSSPAQTAIQSSRFILVCTTSLENPFNSLIIDGIQQAASENHYQVLILQLKGEFLSFEDYDNILKKISLAGIILITSVIEQKLLELLTLSCPIVMCSEYCDVNSISVVSINNVLAARKATEYLISTGCKRIALLNSSLRWHYAQSREQGYLEALNSAGIKKNDDFIVHLPSIDYNLAFSLVSNLLALPEPPDAFFAVSDVLAVSAIHAAKMMGLRIPEDISVMGFDNIAISSMTEPSITTIGQPSVKIGYLSCELLIEKINNPACIRKKILLDIELIVRNSTRRNMIISE